MASDWRDQLSEAALEVVQFDADRAYTRLVVDRAPTGPDAATLRAKLSALTPSNVLRATPRATDEAHALVSALWLRHDYLDESHTISQGIESATGSFWHAIMHRREGDFSNSKYWYARCWQHPVRRELDIDGNELVDLVERAYERPKDDPQHVRAVAAQRAEWEALFAHCVRAAQD